MADNQKERRYSYFYFKKFEKYLLQKNICSNFASRIYDFTNLLIKITEYDTMIKKGKFSKFNGKLIADELKQACDKLPDNNDYIFAIADSGKVRKLSPITYLFSVVLTYLSETLQDHPKPVAIYKYFEDMFAPIHTCTINGEQFDYCELKSEKSIDVNNFIERVVEYAQNEWGVEVPRNETMAKPENRELYSQAYLNQDVDWSSVISSLKSKDNERRIEEKRI